MSSGVRFSRCWRTLRRSPGWVPGAVTAAVLALVIGGIGLAGMVSAASSGAQPGPRLAGLAAGPHAAGQVAGSAHRTAAGQRAGAAGASHRAGAKVASSTAAGHRLRTSCRSVAHIGDSTSVGMVSAAYLPDPAQRLAARYADVGVRHAWIDASGGR